MTARAKLPDQSRNTPSHISKTLFPPKITVIKTGIEQLNTSAKVKLFRKKFLFCAWLDEFCIVVQQPHMVARYFRLNLSTCRHTTDLPCHRQHHHERGAFAHGYVIPARCWRESNCSIANIPYQCFGCPTKAFGHDLSRHRQHHRERGAFAYRAVH